MFHRMPVILVFIVIFVFFFGNSVPEGIQAGLLATSLSIKSVVMMLLPIIIFSLLFQTMHRLSDQSSKLILGILAGVCISNFVSTWMSYGVGSLIHLWSGAIDKPGVINELQPLWIWELPRLLGNDYAMFGGIASGFLVSRFWPALAQKLSQKLGLLVRALLAVFVVMVPLFVIGFVIKMKADGLLSMIVKDYSLIFICVALAQILYIIFLYSIANRFVPQHVLRSIRHMIPAGIAGFSTMSSAAAMPMSIMGVEKNSHRSDWARSVVPLTVNIHLVGDCLAIPVFMFAVLKSYGMPAPAIYTYLLFSLRFVVAKFSVAAVPGGGILVMLPIIESYFGFSSEMLSLVTALYILFDPVITCANVLGNGAFAMLVERGRNVAGRDEF
jgi:Na+/H+-dicarboxylate symporter